MSADRRPHRCWSPRSPRPWPAAPPCKREALPAVHPARPAPERPLNTSRIIHCLQPHPCSCWAPETSLWSEKTLQSSVSVVWVTNTYTEQLCSICNSEANPKAHPGEIRGVRVSITLRQRWSCPPRQDCRRAHLSSTTPSISLAARQFLLGLSHYLRPWNGLPCRAPSLGPSSNALFLIKPFRIAGSTNELKPPWSFMDLWESLSLGHQ